MSLLKRKNKQISASFTQDEASLQNITPIDGRYKSQLLEFSNYFSEYAYIRYRIYVELQYLIFLSENGVAKKLSKKVSDMLLSIYTKFTLEDALQIKKRELVLNHDIKAIEYFLQEKLMALRLDSYTPYIHWGITSDDANNLAYSLALSECNAQVIVPNLQNLLHIVKQIAQNDKKSILLARTHGQPAVPTTFGKEIINFYVRLNQQLLTLKNFQFEGKLMGAVGNLNAHKCAFPKVNWIQKSKTFVSSLGLTPNMFSTQILPLDTWIAYFQTLTTINGILGGLNRDMWTYIMLEEVKLKKKEGEVGSSTMPQKINPIDFENAEGNGEIANSYFQLYERKLISSRLQRDLSDSIVKRTLGTALSHTILSWKSTQKGLQKIKFDLDVSRSHINSHYELLAEAIQTQLRLKNDQEGYEKVKKMTRGKVMTKQLFQSLVSELGLKDLENLTPETYLGYAEELVEESL